MAVEYFNVQDATVRVLNWRNLRKIDWFMPVLVMALVVMGWATLYSAIRSADPSIFSKQIIAFIVGTSIAAIIVCMDYRFLVAIAPVMYVGAVLLLEAVLQFGEERQGATRWLMLGPVEIQPSEFCKIVMIYVLTWYFTTIGERIRKLPYFILPFILTGIPMLQILRQPNLGTGLAFPPLLIAMLFIAGCRIRHLIGLMMVGLSLFPVVWVQMKNYDPAFEAFSADLDKNKIVTEQEFLDRFPDLGVAAFQRMDANQSGQLEVDGKGRIEKSWWQLHNHQKKRIYTFLHPEKSDRDTIWQVKQSMITVGSGGLAGKGYLQGTNTRLSYLPEHHTDFIFCLVAEERGFIGVAFVIGLFTAFLMRGLTFAKECPEMMGTLLATGVVTILAFHVFVNIAITVGMLPVTGIPLPFMSYGRSFYLTTMICVGILLNVPMRRRLFVN